MEGNHPTEKFRREPISGFVFDPEKNIFVHPGNCTIDYRDGGESYILESMKKVHDLSSHSLEFRHYIKDWPSRYHFSHRRLNFLEGIKEVLPKDADVLEIGSGCGTITRWLGENFRRVDALEGSGQRAAITRYRTKDLENVKVYCGDLLATDFDKKYDVITLIGSLEYIPLYDTEHEDPKEACSTLLTRLRSALKDDGVLLVAIENKFGAKYFSGCKEDHTGREFEGIIGYPDKTPVTFSRNEMESILTQTGFRYTQFYHVFPDYKLTETIIPENPEVLPLHPYNWIRTPFEDYEGNRLNLFPDLLFLKSITDSGLLWQCSNSFVILARPTKTSNPAVPWLIKSYKNNENLNPTFYHELTLVRELNTSHQKKGYLVRRSPLHNAYRTDSYRNFEFQLINNDYIAGELLIYDFYTALFKKSPENALKQVLAELHNDLLRNYSIGGKDPEGYPFVKGETIDFTFWNIIIESPGNLNFIDRKWYYKKPLPADLILFRNLFNIFERVGPYLSNKNKRSFILEMIRSIYPQYSEERLSAALDFERLFQTYASGRPQDFTLDSPNHYSFADRITQNQEMEAQIQSLNHAATAKDEQLAEMTSHVRSLELDATAKDEQLAEMTSHVRSLELDATAKDEQLAEMSCHIDALQHALSIPSKDQQFEKISIQVECQEEKLAKMNQQILEITTKALVMADEESIKDLQVQEQIAHIHALEQKISSIEHSIIWQLTMKFHTKVVERLLPQNTRRRRYYDLGLKGGGILVNEGIGKFYWHYNERKRVKKIERSIKKTATLGRSPYTVNNCSPSTIDQVKFSNSIGAAEVSIIIPVFNKFQYTLNCLKSLSDNTTGSFEVVIVDDASTDETVNQLKKIQNLTVIRNKENLGFVESCNTGAKTSKGKYLLFLNNDTVVTENWLPPLLGLINKEDIGAVGAKLVYPDGTLQEAGGIIWSDASGWNYGRGDKPEKSQYNYVRDVDYCSGAALLVRRDLFEKLDGFDRQFMPGYYEDTDLCFSIRELGYRILFQPLSEVIHFEGISNGTDLSTGIKKYQEINRTKFFKKWENRLTKQHYAANSANVFDARIRRNGKKILVIDHYVPTWDRDSGSYRMYNLLKLLVELNHKVTFIGDNLAKFEPYTVDLQQNGIEVIYSPTVQSIDKFLKDNGIFFDIVILSRSHIAIKHYRSVKKYCIHAKIIFDTVDLQYLREQRRAEIENDATVLKEAENLKVTELFLVTHCDMTWVVSLIEKELLLKETPQSRIETLSNIHEVIPCTTPFCDRKDLMFVGGFNHQPNVDAMKWFTKEIFPSIIKSIPNIKLYIIGSDPTKDIERLASSNIIVVGYAKDLTPYFNSCRLFIAPLRYGAGVKGKINQSMSYGLPVVTTPMGAEGMNLLDGVDVLIAESPDIFAQTILAAYDDETLWTTLSKNSIVNIKKYFSFEVTKRQIRKIIELL